MGGIRPEDISAFQSAGVSCFGVGKQLVDAGLFSSYCDEEVFQIIEDRAKDIYRRFDKSGLKHILERN